MKSQIMEGMMRVFIAERGMIMFVGGLQIPRSRMFIVSLYGGYNHPREIRLFINVNIASISRGYRPVVFTCHCACNFNFIST